jgi:ubiquinone/menaquinone biosynthesis C-methylase UbiE
VSKATSNRFSFIAPVYDFLAMVYSFGMISASKGWQIQHIDKGERVLYAGAGGAEDAVLAAKAGAKVTIVELSEGMIAQAQKRISEQESNFSYPITLIQGDITQHQPEAPYDAVVANYFLNVFEPKLMAKVFQSLDALLKDQGKFFIADFAPAKPSFVQAFFQKVYFYAAVTVFRFVAGNGLHPLYDYREVLHKHGYQLLASEDFRLAKYGPAWYRSLCAQKSAQN